MNYFKLTPVVVTLALCTALATTTSYAMDLYVGGSGGQATVDDWNASDIDDGSLSSIKTDDSDTAWKLFGGVALGDYVAVEGSWVDFGETTINATSDGSVVDGFASGAVHASGEASGVALEMLGMYPVNDSISVYGRFGLFLSNVDLKLTDASGTLVDADDQNRDLTYGLGAKFKFAERFSIRAEWQRFEGVGGGDLGSSDIDLLTMGADVSF